MCFLIIFDQAKRKLEKSSSESHSPIPGSSTNENVNEANLLAEGSVPSSIATSSSSVTNKVRPRPHRSLNTSDLEAKESLFASAVAALREGVQQNNKPSSYFAEYLCEKLAKFPPTVREEIEYEILDLVRAKSKALHEAEVLVVESVDEID